MVKKLSILILLFSMLSARAADNVTFKQRFEAAVMQREVTLVDTLLKSGKVDVNTPITYFNKNTPALLMAAEEFDVPMMNVLMNHGVDVTAVDLDGNTVLHALAKSRCTDQSIKDSDVASLMRFLIQKGADVSAKNNEEVTALSLVVEQPSSSSCAEALMVDDIEDRKDALLEAISYSEPKNISKLLLHGTPIDQDHEDCAKEGLDSEDPKILKKDKKTRHLIKHGTQSKYFVNHCFGWFHERLNDKRNPFHILKSREIGRKR